MAARIREGINMGCKSSTQKEIKSKINEVKFHPDNLVETGMIQYFYHSPSSKLPIRDVLNELKQGHKTEPHIEIGAENFLNPCYQPNIKKFAHSKDKYLFLITTCRNKEINEVFGKNKTNQFIVGYIIKNRILKIDEKRYCIKGQTFIYSFHDSISVKDLFGKNFAQSENKGKNLSLMRDVFIDNQKTSDILIHFKNRTNILKKCIKGIIELDQRNPNDKKTCRVLRGLECDFKEECMRWKV